jgi:hypothetical protein
MLTVSPETVLRKGKFQGFRVQGFKARNGQGCTLKPWNVETLERFPTYLRMPSLVMTVLYFSVSYFLR